ncbi:hypothetical protein LMIY3S_04747 [Labrys miyagiensis]
MKKLTAAIASSVFAVSLLGAAPAFAQSAPAPAQPDASTSTPATPAPAHAKKVVKHPKHKAKATKKMAPKKSTDQPSGDDSMQQPAQ